MNQLKKSLSLQKYITYRTARSHNKMFSYYTKIHKKIFSYSHDMKNKIFLKKVAM